MEVSDQIQAPASLLLELTDYDAGWVPDKDWVLWRIENSVGNLNTIGSVDCSLLVDAVWATEVVLSNKMVNVTNSEQAGTWKERVIAVSKYLSTQFVRPRETMNQWRQ
jgi:hypothetical protein